MKDVREILKKRPLLFDGGMGTYYKAKPGQECEQANLLDPDGILTVHRAYLEAGADAIKTNTFGLPRIATIQNVFSLIHRTYEMGLAETCHREAVSLVVQAAHHLPSAVPIGVRLDHRDYLRRRRLLSNHLQVMSECL